MRQYFLLQDWLRNVSQLFGLADDFEGMTMIIEVTVWILLAAICFSWSVIRNCTQSLSLQLSLSQTYQMLCQSTQSFDLHRIRILPQSQQVVQSNHQHVTEHIHRSIHNAQLTTVHISPLYAHLRSRHSETIAQKEQLHIKCESLYVKSFEQQLGSIFCEQFEAALCVLALYAQQQCDYQFEDKGDEFPIPLPLHFALLLILTPRTYYHGQSAVLFLQLPQLTPNPLQLRKSCGSICIYHQCVLSSYQGHACSDSTSFPSIFWVLNYNQIEFEFICLFQCYFARPILATIINNYNLMLGSV